MKQSTVGFISCNNKCILLKCSGLYFLLIIRNLFYVLWGVQCIVAAVHLPWFLLSHPGETRQARSQPLSLPPTGPSTWICTGNSFDMKTPGYSTRCSALVLYSMSLEHKLFLIPFTRLTLTYSLSLLTLFSSC